MLMHARRWLLGEMLLAAILVAIAAPVVARAAQSPPPSVQVDLAYSAWTYDNRCSFSYHATFENFIGHNRIVRVSVDNGAGNYAAENVWDLGSGRKITNGWVEGPVGVFAPPASGTDYYVLTVDLVTQKKGQPEVVVASDSWPQLPCPPSP